ncbi:MAG: hypothetical protein B7Z02_07565 [Rhodobacterales bacterium 32-67-9]|nr:MAG: hypothetical protein B7Z02_07565 [Rhodobacterales bacterium 32-67-9]
MTDASGADIEGLSRRGQAMLAYLSRQPGLRAERGLLADLLWTDRGEDQARASLRQELSVLRRHLPDGVIVADRQMVRLEPDSFRFRSPTPGEFLEGFDLASEGFEDWLRLMRAASPEKPAPSATVRAGRRIGLPCLAILPFDELGSAEGDMFADGVVEEITAALSRVHEFHVIARQSAFAVRDARLDVPAVSERLGTDYLIEGTVQRAQDRVRINVQLVRGTDGRLLWSQRFDDRLDDLFDLQDRIAAAVAGQISPSLRTAEIARAETKAPADRSAYELVLSAMPHFWTHSRAGNARALELLDLALEEQESFGPALAYKAWVLAQQPSYMWSDDPLADRAAALELTRVAAAHVADHAPSLVALGAAVSLVSPDLDLANSFIDRALAIDPNNAWGWLRRGWNRNYSGQIEEARACFDRAEALSPLDPFLFNIEFGRGGARLNENRYEEALAHFRRGMTLSPSADWAWRTIAVLNTRLGRPDAAAEALRKLYAAYPGLTIRKVAASIPPTIIENQPDYYAALRTAGVPEG